MGAAGARAIWGGSDSSHHTRRPSLLPPSRLTSSLLAQLLLRLSLWDQLSPPAFPSSQSMSRDLLARPTP